MPTKATTQTVTPEGTGLAEALVDFSHHVLHLFAEAGRQDRLSQQQIELICALVVRGAVRMSELGSVLRVEKSNLSNLVDRLEQRGLVTRHRDPEDRRATLVRLTDAGTTVAVKTYESVTGQLRVLLEQVPGDEQRRLLAALGALLQDKRS